MEDRDSELISQTPEDVEIDDVYLKVVDNSWRFTDTALERFPGRKNMDKTSADLRFKEKAYKQLRAQFDQGVPDDIKTLITENDVVTIKIKNRQYQITVKQIKAGEKIGAGAEGEVFKLEISAGRNKKMSVVVKIKVINSEAASYDSLMNEVILGASDGLLTEYTKNHRFGTELLSHFRFQNKLYLVYKEGGMGLDKFSKLVHQEYGHFPNFGLVYIIYKLVERLQMLHYNLRVAHLDVKPANILIRRGKVTLADFGVCQVMNPSDDRNSNKAGAGTAAYFPQETWRDQADAGDNNSATTCRTLGITSVDSTTTSRKLKLPEYQYMEQHDIYCLGRSLLHLIKVPVRISGLVDKKIYSGVFCNLEQFSGMKVRLVLSESCCNISLPP